MNYIEYSNVCDNIIQQTMQYIDTGNMRSYKLDKTLVESDDPVYVSAAASSAPIVLAYTPAGVGISALIEDRVKLLQASGVPSEHIIVLNMNIAKVKQMSRDLPGVRVMDFNAFTHGIFAINNPECELSDIDSIASTLRLVEPNDLINKFIQALSIRDPKERMVMCTLFANKYQTFTPETLKAIGKSDYALESMICQNALYSYPQNPYEGVEAILINGVTNMSIPILCTILEYANMYRCNLFITGSPDETLYEYNMAYANSMNIISSYNQKMKIDIIRLTKPKKMSKDILNLLKMNPTAKISRSVITAGSINMDFGMSVVEAAMQFIGPGNPYLGTRLKKHEPVLVLARSRRDIKDIKEAIINCYYKDYPNLKILDLTERQIPSAIYGEFASKHINDLVAKYPRGLVVGELLNDVYNWLDEAERNSASVYTQSMYNDAKYELLPFSQRHMDKFVSLDQKFDNVKELVQLLIDTESQDIQSVLNDMKEKDTMDMTGMDIVMSTVHTAMDIRMDHVIAFIKTNKNAENQPSTAEDEAFYRVALSRANKTECIIFANYGCFDLPHERYLKEHFE